MPSKYLKLSFSCQPKKICWNRLGLGEWCYDIFVLICLTLRIYLKFGPNKTERNQFFLKIRPCLNLIHTHTHEPNLNLWNLKTWIALLGLCLNIMSYGIPSIFRFYLWIPLYRSLLTLNLKKPHSHDKLLGEVTLLIGLWNNNKSSFYYSFRMHYCDSTIYSNYTWQRNYERLDC